jgi:hypothetical protein
MAEPTGAAMGALRPELAITGMTAFEVSNLADTPTAAGIDSAPSSSLHGSCSKEDIDVDVIALTGPSANRGHYPIGLANMQ